MGTSLRISRTFSPRVSFSGRVLQDKLWFMYASTYRFIHSFLEDVQTPVVERKRSQ